MYNPTIAPNIEDVLELHESHKDNAIDYNVLRGTSTFAGVPCVSDKLVEFATEIQKRIPNVQFAYCHTGENCYISGTWDEENGGRYVDGGTAQLELYVYFPYDPHPAGTISYYNYGKRGLQPTFNIISRHIENKARHGWARYLKKSTDIKVALKNAVAAFLPFSPAEIVASSCDEFDHMYYTAVTKPNSNACAELESLSRDPTILSELQLLMSSGYKFSNPVTQQKVERMIELSNSINEHKRQQTGAPGYHVHVREDVTGTVEITRIPNMLDREKMRDVGYKRSVFAPAETYTVETLDEHIAGRLAVLSMMPLKQWMPGVGARVTPTTYFVHA